MVEAPKLPQHQELKGKSIAEIAAAQGIAYTVVNGTVLIDHGEHTGTLPGRIHRNALYI